MKTQSGYLLTLALCLLLIETALAQECPAVIAEPEDSPRIGLVLGGGGARGAAHIGVLQELERLRVPVHAVAGTSMGAIVGGFFAAGMSPDELQELVQTLDWDASFQDGGRRQDKSFRRKQDDAQFPIQFELGLNDAGLQLPKGLIQGQNLQLLLREALFDVSDIRDFDDLPTPFRAVASDLALGEPYVMGEGDLALAIRASMSAPGVFAPVEYNGRTLVDGGLVSNVPVDVGKSMGVDVVIAVDVEFPLYQPQDLGSALTVTEQMLTILIRKETRRSLDKLCAHDVLIRPELGNFGSTDFDNIETVIEPGAAAARAVIDKLALLSVSEADYADYLATREREPFRPGSLDRIIINSESGLAPRVLEARLETEPGDSAEPARLAQDAERLYGLNSFESVSYQVLTEGGETTAEFNAVNKSWGPNFLQFGMTIEDDLDGSTALNLSARLTMTGLNSLGAEWRNDLQIGTDPEFRSEFYQPLSFDSRYFVAPYLDLKQENVQVFEGANNVATYRITDSTIGVDLGRQLGNWGELRLGAFRGGGNSRRTIGDPQFENFDFESGGFLTRFSVDTLDDAQIPKDGTRAVIEWQNSRTGMGADANFEIVEVVAEKAWSWGANSVQVGAEYATTIDSDGQLQNFFPLGGFARLSGFQRGALSGPHAGLLRLMYFHDVASTIGDLFGTPTYLGASVEAGNVWQSRSEMAFNSLLINGSIFAGIDTYFGIVFLAAGFSETGDSSFYLIVGNPRRL